jgi:hypothetical protein
LFKTAASRDSRLLKLNPPAIYVPRGVENGRTPEIRQEDCENQTEGKETRS